MDASAVARAIADVGQRPGVAALRRTADEGLEVALAETAGANSVERLRTLVGELDTGAHQAIEGAAQLRDLAAAARQESPEADALHGVELLRSTADARTAILANAPVAAAIPDLSVRLDQPIAAAAARHLGKASVEVTFPAKKGPGTVKQLAENVQVGPVEGILGRDAAIAAATAHAKQSGGSVVGIAARGSNRYFLLANSESLPQSRFSRFLRRDEVIEPGLRAITDDVDFVVTARGTARLIRDRAPLPQGEPAHLSLERLRELGATEVHESPALQLEAEADALDAARTKVGELRPALAAERRLARELAEFPSKPGTGGPLDWEEATHLLRNDDMRAVLELDPDHGAATFDGGRDLYEAVRTVRDRPAGTTLAITQDTTGRYHLAQIGGGGLRAALHVRALEDSIGSLEAHPDVRAIAISGGSARTPFVLGIDATGTAKFVEEARGRSVDPFETVRSGGISAAGYRVVAPDNTINPADLKVSPDDRDRARTIMRDVLGSRHAVIVRGDDDQHYVALTTKDRTEQWPSSNPLHSYSSDARVKVAFDGTDWFRP